MAPAAANVVHDLSAEFSTVSNPSGGPGDGWGYNAGGLFAGPAGPFGGYSTGDFAAEFGWTNPGANHLGWSQISNGGAPQAFDILNGDVITHASTSVAWQATAATAGDYLIDLSGWTIRDLGRTTTLNLYKNDATLLAGPIILDDSTSRALPGILANSLAVNFSAGDYVRLTVDGNDYTAVNFTLTPGIAPPPPPPANPNAYYRFEEGGGGDIFDSFSGEDDGNLVGPSFYSTDVPFPVVPRTGAANQYSMDFTQGGFALMNGHAFIFHNAPGAGGAAGDATFEWFMKIPISHEHAPMFWTRGEDNADTNRFNLFWNAGFTGATDSERFIDGDFRDPSGAAHNVGGPGYNGGDPLTINEWHHVAIVRHDLGGGAFQWDWYIDGVLSAGHTAVTTDPMPTSLSWLIAGRQGGHSLNMLVDEIRFSDRALSPGEFLNAVPEPSTWLLALFSGGAVAAWRHRRRA
jgi:hypothetical protein